MFLWDVSLRASIQFSRVCPHFKCCCVCLFVYVCVQVQQAEKLRELIKQVTTAQDPDTPRHLFKVTIPHLRNLLCVKCAMRNAQCQMPNATNQDVFF